MDQFIFEMFDIGNGGQVTKRDLRQMLLTLPDQAVVLRKNSSTVQTEKQAKAGTHSYSIECMTGSLKHYRQGKNLLL